MTQKLRFLAEIPKEPASQIWVITKENQLKITTPLDKIIPVVLTVMGPTVLQMQLLLVLVVLVPQRMDKIKIAAEIYLRLKQLNQHHKIQILMLTEQLVIMLLVSYYF